MLRFAAEAQVTQFPTCFELVLTRSTATRVGGLLLPFELGKERPQSPLHNNGFMSGWMPHNGLPLRAKCRNLHNSEVLATRWFQRHVVHN